MRKHIIQIIPILVLIGLIYALVQWKEVKSSDNELLQQTIRPKIKTIEKKRLISGHLYPDREIKIKSPVSGVVDKIFVKEGEYVQTGDKIAKIKLVPDPSQIESARHNVNTARIKYNLAKKDYKRKKQLYKKELIAKTTFEQSKQSYAISKEQYKSAKRRLQLIKEGIAKSLRDVSNIVEASTNGTILNVPVKKGSSVIKRNNFNPGTNIAVIAELDSFIFKGKVNESDLYYMNEGMNMELTINALNDYETSAILTKISPKGTKEHGIMKYRFEAKVQIPTDSLKVRSGYSASAKIVLQKKDSVCVIPEKYLSYKDDSAYVNLLCDNNEFIKYFVKPGISDGISIEIKNGLDTNDRIKKYNY